jgi:HK97 family phage prohead protease
VSENFHVRQSATWNVDGEDLEFRASPDGDGLTVSGYIARFGDPTVIEDWMGNYTEELKRGAFTRTLAERGASKVKMQFNHGADSAFGALPVGVWTDLREDRKGLFGEGRIHDTWHTIPIQAAIRSGALDGMSFKFKVIQDAWRKGDPKANTLDHRTLTEVALYEAGMVVHPAYESTTLALRSRALDMLRREMGDHASDVPAPVRADTLTDEKAVAPVGDTDPVRAEAGPPVGITRREMRQKALSALGVIHDSDRGAA